MGVKERLAVRVPLEKAEEVRRKLVKKNLVVKDLKITRDREHVYIPVKENVEIDDHCVIVKRKFDEKKQVAHSYKDLVRIPGGLRNLLPSSYDVVGDIILIKIPWELRDYEEDIGEALLQTHGNVETVCNIQPVTGTFRTRGARVIAGKQKTLTMHQEYGLKLFVDVEKTYFSPRLANERKRIADIVEKDETVVDMFTGVAPFPVMIAKYAEPMKIVAMDKNLSAVKLAQRNVVINHVEEKISVFNEDANNVEKVLKEERADRVIMNLPFSAHEFFNKAIKIVSNSAVIHYYEILKEEDVKKRAAFLRNIAEKNNVEITDVKTKKIKTYSPREFYICFDITTQKKLADVA